ncbi:MAG: signal peptide peptidase SppA [Candidatus Rokubacteria bacterium]|nr:signal peptide peptidase SppA [Candidatus Rokubacteria bacterium]
MASRGRTVGLAFGLIAGVVLVFLATVWVLMAVLEDGAFPGGARVAVVEVEGLIVSGDDVVRDLKEHAENPAVRAVVVRVNSPGGVVAPTQEIVGAIHRVRQTGKPVVASLGAVAASGGYYVATAADRIYANPGTLTGSIGVLMQLANVEGLLKRVGVEYVVVKAGAYKDVGSLARAMSPEERRILQTLLDDVYGQFVAAVAAGRGLDREVVLGFADGRIYSGQQAQKLRMVDELGGFEDAVDGAAKLANITGKPRLIFPRRKFSVSEWVRSQVGIPSASHFIPSLPALKTPLYLMD